MTKLSAALIFSALLGAPFACGDELIGRTGTQFTPLPTWSGFYVGLNAGGLWNNGNAPATVDWSRLVPGNSAYSTAFASVPQAGFAWTKAPDFIGGGQVGYNWQLTDRIVVGVETDFQGVAGGGNNWNSGWMTNSSSNKGPSSIGSVRGRGGYLVAPNLQVYGTGGFSYSGGN